MAMLPSTHRVTKHSPLSPFPPGDRSLTASARSESPAAVRMPRRESIPLGILYMICATALFAGSSAISKLLVVAYPVGEVLFSRCLVGFACVAALILPRFGLDVFRTRRFGAHVLRSISQTCSQTFILIAFSLMPLAGAVAINFSAPLFATLIAAIVFKETVGPVRWLALIVGFVGVLLVTHPGP